MRRGLFIASDEVAAYTQSIFNDRIQKREAHLRWAAEVTSTINVDQLLSKPKLGPEFTGNSDVQAQAAKPAGVRPAAGMPAAPITGPMAEPEQGHGGYSSQNQQQQDDMKTTGPSVATTAAPRTLSNPNANANVGSGPPRPSQGRGAGPAPRPAAGNAHAQQQQQQQQHDDFEDDHPADGDGPTIQALPPMADPLPPMHLGVTRQAPREPMHSEPPTMMTDSSAVPSSQNDGPTMMAAPGARAQMIAASASEEPMTIEPEDDFEEEEDQDETMVANTRGDAHPLQAPPTFPQPSPAAGRPNAQAQAAQSQRRPPPPSFNQTAAIGQQVPPMLNPLGYPQGQQSQPHQQHQHQQQQQRQGPGPAHTGEVAFSATMGMSQPPHAQHGGHDPNQYGAAMATQPQDFVPRSGPSPTGPSGEYIPRQSPQMRPTFPRMAAPTHDNRTMTAQRYKRRPPMWVVAALSCSIALLIAGVVIAIVSSTSNPPAPKPSSSGAASPGASGVATPQAVGVGSAGGAGPFSSARAAFNNVVSPGSSVTPPPVPPGAVTAPPPVVTAAAEPPASATPAAATPPAVVAVAAAAPPPPAAAPAAPPPVIVAVAPPPARLPTPPPVVAAAAAPRDPPKTSKPAALGAITVVCMPKCDQIVDNGTSLGPGHIFNRPVPSGRHVLQLSAPNGARKNLVVEVVADQTKEVRMSMDK